MPRAQRCLGGIRLIDAVFTDGSSGVFLTAEIGVDSYAGSWRQKYFGSPENAGHGSDSIDADNDGMSNLLERTLGLHPFQPAPLPVQAEIDGGIMEFINPRSTASLAETTFAVNWGSDLVTWSSEGITETVLDPGGITPDTCKMHEGGSSMVA